LKAAAQATRTLVSAASAIEKARELPGDPQSTTRNAMAWAFYNTASSMGHPAAAAERDRVGAKLPADLKALAKEIAAEMRGRLARKK
jgi:hypothetical protein